MNDRKNESTQLVSVIIPVYNGEQFLAEAIESVLAQSYPTYELIVVDDGSTDRTREIAQSFPAVKYVYQANRGSASARNRGIQIAQGEYLAFLDADDLWLPDKISLQTKAFETNPEAEIVTGYVQQFVNSELNPPAGQRYTFVDTPIPGYSPIAVLIRRSVMDKVGLFHENYKTSEVISWFVEALEQKPNIFILPQVVARRRIHGKNVSLTNQGHKNEDMIRILKNSIDRKRLGGSNRDHSK